MTDRALRLATWNIHMGIGRDGVRDLGRTARVINKLESDLIGLQEVDNHIRDGEDDIDHLKMLTGMNVIAGPTMDKATGDYGNALLTNLPVLKVERYDLSFKRYEPRGLMICHIDWLGERIRVAVTHLGLRPGERRYQVRALIEALSDDDDSPLILMGDFNEWLFWGRPLRWLHRHFGKMRSPATFPARRPLFCLDQILAEPHRRLGSKAVVKTPLTQMASDHLPLLADFK